MNFALSAYDNDAAGEIGLASVVQTAGPNDLGIDVVDIKGDADATYNPAINGAVHGTYAFLAKDRVGNETELTLSDGSDYNAVNETAFIYTLTIDPVNDAPDAIRIDAVTNESHPATDMFKDGDTVLVRFCQSDDFRWAQEIQTSDIRYQLQYCMNGLTWTQETEAAYDADGFRFAAPDGMDTDRFHVRVRAIDDGSTFNGTRPDGSMGRLAANGPSMARCRSMCPSPTAQLDYATKAWTNGDVTLILATADVEPVANDATVVDIVRCEDITAGRAEADREACAVVATGTDGEYSVTVAKNGAYKFTVIDSVGNVTTLNRTIDNIDKLAPFANAQPADNTSVLNANGGITVRMSMADRAANAFNAKSELAGSAYFIDSSAANPASGDARWINVAAPYTGAQRLIDERGTFYAHTKVHDAAGTKTIQTFGPFIIMNNEPVLAAPSNLYTVQNQSVSGTGSATDADGDTLRISGSSANEGVISSGNVHCSISGGVLNISVTPAANAYSVGGSGASTEKGKALAGKIAVSARDEADGEFVNRSFGFSIASDDQGRHGRFRVDAQGNVSYTPNDDFVGDDSAMVSVTETQTFTGNVNPAAIPSGAFAAGADRLGVKVRVNVAVKAPDPTPTPRPTPTPVPSATPEPEVTGTPRPTLPIITPNPDPTVDPLTLHDPNATPDPNALTEVSFGDPNGETGGGVPIHRLRAFNFVNGVNFEEAGIPLGALPCFASVAGFNLEQIEKLLGELNDDELTRLYSDHYLPKVFNMPQQMLMPIDFDEIDWERLPERGYELPIIANGISVVARAWFRPVLNEKLEEGYLFEIEFEPGVLGDANFAGIHFATQLRNVMMSETQYMDPTLFEREDEWRMNQFILKAFMTGKQFIYIAVPVVSDAEGYDAFVLTEEQLQDWHDRTGLPGRRRSDHRGRRRRGRRSNRRSQVTTEFHRPRAGTITLIRASS